MKENIAIAIVVGVFFVIGMLFGNIIGKHNGYDDGFRDGRQFQLNAWRKHED